MFEVAQGRNPRLGILAHPPVVDEPDRDGVQEVQLLAPAPLGHDEAGLLEHSQVLHHAEARHRQAPLERAQCLAFLFEQLVEQPAACRVGEGPEHIIHAVRIRDCLVTCQGERWELGRRGRLTVRPARLAKRNLPER